MELSRNGIRISNTLHSQTRTHTETHCFKLTFNPLNSMLEQQAMQLLLLSACPSATVSK